MSPPPLSGVRVLDLTRLLPGPYATLVLADLGATVDKLEDPSGGDYLRQMPPHLGEESALFYGLNRNKRSIALDLRTEEGAAALKRLIPRYDVLVESFRPGVMSRLGLSFRNLSAENPRLIYCSITGYGQTGPDRLKAGHDLNYMARSGALAYGGAPDGPPAMPGVQMADVGGGSLFGLVSILTALYERERTGRGRFLDVSMTEGAMAFVHMQLAARLAMGDQGKPLKRGVEPLNGGYPCYGLYKTRDDRWLSVASLEPKFLVGLCEKLGRPDLTAGAYDSGDEGKAVRRELEAIFAERTLAEWLAELEGTDLCIEPVREGDEILEDPHLVARGVFLKAEDNQRGLAVTHLRTPLRFEETPLRPPPALGQHTDAILKEAGFSDEERAALASPAAAASKS